MATAGLASPARESTLTDETLAQPKLVACLSDIEAIERVPLKRRDLPATTYEALARGAALAPTAPALSFFLRVADFRQPFVWTHHQWLAEIHRAANLFRRLGVGRTDVIAFVLPNLPETHFVIWGGEAAGIVFAINPLLAAEQIAELLRTAKAKWLVTLAPTPKLTLWEKSIAAASQVTTLQGILTVSVAPYMRGPAGVLFKSLSRMKPPRAPELSLPILDLRRQMSQERGDQLNFELAEPDDIASYFCTGGTTGLPKIAMRTQLSEAFDAWTARQMIDDGRRLPGPVFCGLPLFHVNGQIVTGIAQWIAGGHVVLGTPQGYRAEGLLESFWDMVEHYRLASFSGVPTLYSALLQYPVGNRDVSSLEFALSGAAPLPVKLFHEFQAKTGVKICEGYGLTEAACASSFHPLPAAPRIGSIGLRLPYQRMAIMILDEDGKFVRWAETDEVGVVAISGPNVFAGYVNAVHNHGIWVDADGRRWLNTGDLGRQDADGYFWLTGRKKELIIRGGHNLDPKSIEEAIQQHPQVALAAAVGRPDPYAGEVPVVYVTLRDGGHASAADLMDYARRVVPEPPAMPKAIRIVDQLPTTPVGKIFKPELIMREMESVVREEAEPLGVELASVKVLQDATRGLLAQVEIRGDHRGLPESLGRYAFPTEFLATELDPPPPLPRGAGPR